MEKELYKLNDRLVDVINSNNLLEGELQALRNQNSKKKKR